MRKQLKKKYDDDFDSRTEKKTSAKRTAVEPIEDLAAVTENKLDIEKVQKELTDVPASFGIQLR